MSGKSVIVFGPQGCGKSMHARQMAAAFNLRHILDDWWDIATAPPALDTLVLSHESLEELRRRGYRRLLPYERAMEAVRQRKPLEIALSDAERAGYR